MFPTCLEYGVVVVDEEGYVALWKTRWGEIIRYGQHGTYVLEPEVLDLIPPTTRPMTFQRAFSGRMLQKDRGAHSRPYCPRVLVRMLARWKNIAGQRPIYSTVR